MTLLRFVIIRKVGTKWKLFFGRDSVLTTVMSDVCKAIHHMKTRKSCSKELIVCFFDALGRNELDCLG